MKIVFFIYLGTLNHFQSKRSFSSLILDERMFFTIPLAFLILPTAMIFIVSFFSTTIIFSPTKITMFNNVVRKD